MEQGPSYTNEHKTSWSLCVCVCVCVYREREKQSKDKHVEKGEISLGSGGPENIPRIAMTILLLPPPC